LIIRPEQPTSIDQLPLPKRLGRAPATEGYLYYIFNQSCEVWTINRILISAAMAATGITASRPEVKMADKIAMRSLVLSKTLPRIGGQNFKIFSEEKV